MSDIWFSQVSETVWLFIDAINYSEGVGVCQTKLSIPPDQSFTSFRSVIFGVNLIQKIHVWLPRDSRKKRLMRVFTVSVYRGCPAGVRGVYFGD